MPDKTYTFELFVKLIIFNQSYPKKWASTAAGVCGCSSKYLFEKILQNSQDNTGAGISFLINLHVSSLQLYWKRDSNTSGFYEYLFYTEHLQATASGFNLKLIFFDGYSSRILMKDLGTTLWKYWLPLKRSFPWSYPSATSFFIQIKSGKSLCLELK